MMENSAHDGIQNTSSAKEEDIVKLGWHTAAMVLSHINKLNLSITDERYPYAKGPLAASHKRILGDYQVDIRWLDNQSEIKPRFYGKVIDDNNIEIAEAADFYNNDKYAIQKSQSKPETEYNATQESVDASHKIVLGLKRNDTESFITPVSVRVADLLEHMGAFSIGRPSSYASIIEELDSITEVSIETETSKSVVGLANLCNQHNHISLCATEHGIRSFLKIKSVRPDWASNEFSLGLLGILHAVERQYIEAEEGIRLIIELLKIDEHDQLVPKTWSDVDDIYDD